MSGLSATAQITPITNRTAKKIAAIPPARVRTPDSVAVFTVPPLAAGQAEVLAPSLTLSHTVGLQTTGATQRAISRLGRPSRSVPEVPIGDARDALRTGVRGQA